MNVLTRLSALTLVAFSATAAMATTPAPAATAAAATPAAKPIVKTTCTDYTAMDASFKPKFIYFAVGHGKHGAKEAFIDEVGIEKIQPELDEYCKVHLGRSAYDKVIASSMASEHAAHKAPMKTTK